MVKLPGHPAGNDEQFFAIGQITGLINGYVIEYNARSAGGVSGGPCTVGNKVVGVHYSAAKKANRAHPIKLILKEIVKAYGIFLEF